jgi:hypothetical protein
MSTAANPYKQLAQEKKARKLADMMARAIDALDVDPGVILADDSKETRAKCMKAAHVDSASMETWGIVVTMLREREAVRRLYGVQATSAPR